MYAWVCGLVGLRYVEVIVEVSKTEGIGKRVVW